MGLLPHHTSKGKNVCLKQNKDKKKSWIQRKTENGQFDPDPPKPLVGDLI
jgi:hypothetical protein